MTHKKAGEDDRKVAIGRSRKKTTLPNESDSQHDEHESECQKCKTSCEVDEEKQQATWIGCDNCWRWYHYQCAGLHVKPAEDDYWCCPFCKK